MFDIKCIKLFVVRVKTDLNVALVGCGRVAKKHAEVLKSNITGLRLKAVADKDSVKAKEMGKLFNVNSYEDMHQMMQAEHIDIVSVLTESGSHASIVLDLAKYKKHIIVEKPMALKLSDADLMIEECDKMGIRLFVVKQNRYNLPIIKLKEAINEKRLGKIFLGTVRVRWCRKQEYYDQDSWRGTWSMDGGVLTNQASHHIDMLLWMLGEVESVFGMASRAIADIQAEDTAVVNIKFKSGALGIVEATTATRPCDLEGSISVLGDKGTVEVGGFAMNKMKIWKFEEEYDSDKSVVNDFNENPPNVYGFGHKKFYENVFYSIKNNDSFLIDGLSGRKSLEVINAIYESIETGKKIDLGYSPKVNRLGY